jgi:uncharacterized protein YhfF
MGPTIQEVRPSPAETGKHGGALQLEGVKDPLQGSIQISNPDHQPILQQYWQAFVDSRPGEADSDPQGYDAWGFGNTPEMADGLGELVRLGVKTATASLAWWYEAEGEAYPRVGSFNVILDGRRQPICIVQTTEVVELPFNQVDAAHAFEEGEGDRSLAFWRRVHWDFFSAECRELGREPSEDMPVVCEKFRRVYP